jgi:hypothetical protein
MEILPPDTHGTADDYDSLPWLLLEQKTNRHDNKLTFKPIDVPCYNFVGKLLKDMAIHHPYKAHTLLLAISQFWNLRILLHHTHRINRSSFIKHTWAYHGLGQQALCRLAPCVHAMASGASSRPSVAPTQGQETPTNR